MQNLTPHHPVERWYAYLTDSAVADAILDCIVRGCARDRAVATAWRLHSAVLAQSFGYARLPTRAGGLPALDDIDGKPNGDKLARDGGPGPAALVHDRTGQSLLSDFRQILVLVSPNHMGIDLG